MASGRLSSKHSGRHARAAAGAVRTTANSWRRGIISRFTTSPGGPCRGNLASEPASGSGLAAEPARRVRGDAGALGRDQQHCAPCSDGRIDDRARPRLGSRRKRGQTGQALCRSCGGFSTKIHLKCDFNGLPLAVHLTGGQASDSRNFETLLELGPDITPRAVIGDEGYDSTANRKAARRRGICPVIPYRSNATAKPKSFPSALYKGRARIEQSIGRLKRFKRIAWRCEKTVQNVAAFISLACIFIWAKSVHTA